MIEPRGFLVWAMKVSGVTPNKPEAPLSRPAEATVFFLIDGYPNHAIAREMGISAHQVAQYVRETIAKLAVQEWSPEEYAMFEAMAQRLKSEETAYQHFSALLDALRNCQDPTPRFKDFDEGGRVIGGRSPLVDVDRAMSACRGIASYPSKLRVTRAAVPP